MVIVLVYIETVVTKYIALYTIVTLLVVVFNLE